MMRNVYRTLNLQYLGYPQGCFIVAGWYVFGDTVLFKQCMFTIMNKIDKIILYYIFFDIKNI